MKKTILLLTLVFAATFCFAQSTYYWVGGTTGTWSSASSWNTALNGSGSTRSVANTADVLIFDGTNIGGASPATGTATPTITSSYTIAQLKFQNSANVILQRGSSSGTSTITVNGDGTSSDDLTIDGTSSLKINSTGVGYSFVLQVGVTSTSTATGSCSGTITITDNGATSTSTSTRLAIMNANSFNFLSGSLCYINNSYSSNYPFGSPSASSNPTVALGLNFQSGSTLVYQGGVSPYTTTSANIPLSFLSGSTLEIDAAITATNLLKGHTLSNLVITNNATAVADGSPYFINNLTINSGSTFNLATTGTYPVAGNIVNNGTFGAASGYTSTHLIMIGTAAQTISGSGTFNNIGNFSVATDANVTINQNLSVSGNSTSTVTGKLNTQGYTISGTGNFQLRPSATATTTSVSLTSGSNTIQFSSSSVYSSANISIGCLVTGVGIPANTYIVATSSSSFNINISNAITTTTTSDITITNNAATLTLSNSGGIDAAIATTGTRNFGSTTNYIFNAATITAIPSILTAINDLTVNANVTLNNPVSVNGTVTVSSGTLTTGGNLTLNSTSTGNARIASGSGSYLSGTVIVKQYIPAGFRKYRFLSHPFTTAQPLSQLTDNIDITGTGGNANGFTTTPTNNPSAFYFNTTTADGGSPTDAGWNAFADATSSTWNKGQGIRVLVRGTSGQSGTLDGTNATPAAVTLDMSGTVNTGAVSVSLATGGSGATAGFNLVGNPYPSPVDIGAVLTTAGSNVGNTFYVRNPQTGSYTTINPVPSTYMLPAYSAFFVKANSATSLSFAESNKNTCSSCPVVFGANTSNQIQLRVYQNNIEYDNLYLYIQDGTKAAFEPNKDAVKLTNDGLTLYTLSEDKQKLAADYRNIAGTSTIAMGVSLPVAYGKQTYTIKVDNYNVDNGIQLSLHDKLTDTYTELRKDANYTLGIDPSVASNIGEGRLEILSTKSTAIINNASIPDAFTVSVASNNNQFIVKYASPEAANTNIRLMNITGQPLQTIQLGKQQQGQLTLAADKLSNGLYLVEVQMGNNKVVKKVERL